MARFVLYMLPLLVVRASMIAKKPPSFESLANKNAFEQAHRPCKQGDLFCVDANGATEKEKGQASQAQDSVQTPKTTVRVDSSDAKPQAVVMDASKAPKEEGEAAAQKCLCDIQGSDKCACSSACDKRQEMAICAALLGPCTCEERAGSMCECSGHCPAMGDLMHACQSAPGCMWDGAFCAAEKASPKIHYGSEKKSDDEELLDAAEAEVQKAAFNSSKAKAAFKLPKYVQALCALVAAGLAAFVLLHL